RRHVRVVRRMGGADPALGDHLPQRGPLAALADRRRGRARALWWASADGGGRRQPGRDLGARWSDHRARAGGQGARRSTWPDVAVGALDTPGPVVRRHGGAVHAGRGKCRGHRRIRLRAAVPRGLPAGAGRRCRRLLAAQARFRGSGHRYRIRRCILHLRRISPDRRGDRIWLQRCRAGADQLWRDDCVGHRRNGKRRAGNAAPARRHAKDPGMTTLAAFCARTGIGEAAVRQALDARAAHDDAPWYMQAVLGIGAWVTAIAALLFAGAVMDLVFGIDEPNLAVAIVGAVVFGASLWLLHHRPEGAFTAHAAVAFATAGTLLAAAGIGMPEEGVWAAAAVTLPFAAAAIWQQRSLLLQFLIVSVALILAILAVWDHWSDVISDLPAIFAPFGVAL